MDDLYVAAHNTIYYVAECHHVGTVMLCVCYVIQFQSCNKSLLPT